MAVVPEVLDASWVARNLPPRPPRAHKGTFGRLLVVAGSIDYPGAALLTALGAMRAGAGVVRVAAADTVVERLAGAVPELTWMALDEEARGLIAPSGWRRITTESAAYDAIVVGPGLGRHPATQRRARQLLAGLRTPCVVDADGLNALAAEPRWWKPLRGPFVLTPHPGEMARLTGADAPDSDDDEERVGAAVAAAGEWGQVVVLKGAHSVVAAPDGRVARSTVASPALATAGTGDLLAGMIGAYLGAGAPAFEAAGSAVAVHAAAGRLAAERIGDAGVMARDVAALLPEAVRRLRERLG